MSRSYKKYRDKDDNIKGVSLTFLSKGNIISDGSKYVIDKTKKVLNKGSLQTQLSSLYYQLGKLVFQEYLLEIDNSKKIKKCLKKMKSIKDDLDTL